jgi:hypothetical protein
MPYLAQGQANRVEILGLFPVDSKGFIFDPDTVEFRVLDPDGDESIGWTDVTSSGRKDVGVYYAPFTPASDAEIGVWSIEWRWTDADDSDTEQTWSQSFDIYTAGFGVPYWTYVTPRQLRAEGVDTTALPDLRMVELIKLAQSFIERECRQPFRPVRRAVDFDGNGSALWLAPMPILGVEYLRINRSTIDLNHDQYAAYTSPFLGTDPGYLPKDNRKNPRVKLIRGLSPSPFRAGRIIGSGGTGRFLPGAKAHTIKAVWGFLEPDGTTPPLIQNAALRLVLATATLMADAASSSTIAGPVVREQTDTHEIEYADTVGSWDYTALATSPEVQDILRRYRAPLALGAPATTWGTQEP